MKKRGFTLIELIAVIIILAIISLIAIPAYNNVVKDAKKDAAEVSVKRYVSAIEYEVQMANLFDTPFPNKDDYTYDEISVSLKGDKPTDGIYGLYNNEVTEGVFCMNGYIVNYNNSQAIAGETCENSEFKFAGSVKLSSYGGEFRKDETKNIMITENVSGGALSCSSSDEFVATCSITGDTLSVNALVDSGTATITVISEETVKHRKAQAAYLVTTDGGVVAYSAAGYTGVYDGNQHSISVNSLNSLITYGTSLEDCNSTVNPVYTDAGEYTVYFKIKKEGYEEIVGSKIVKITQASGLVELEENSGQVEYSKDKTINIVINKSNGTLSAISSNNEIIDSTIENSNLKITGMKVGTANITVSSGNTNNYTSATTNYSAEVIKTNNVLKLASYVGTIAYPDVKNIDITENLSRGALSCESSDTTVATCDFEGMILKIIPTVKAGSATITVKSAPTTNYNGGQVAYYATTESGTLAVTPSGYNGVYDGNPHSITVETSGTVTYALDPTDIYEVTKPTFTNVGTYTVYYKVIKDGYTTVVGSEEVVITKANGSITAPTAKSLIYNESNQKLVNAGSSTTGTVMYKLDNGVYAQTIPVAKDPGTYTVYYKVIGDNNHNDVSEKHLTITITKGNMTASATDYTGVYDGNPHSINVIATDGATVKYSTTLGGTYTTTNPSYVDVGIYTTYYEISKPGYNSITGNNTITITKANNEISLSEVSGTITYPDELEIEITKNTSGGTLTCESSNLQTATCKIENNKLIITPQTQAGDSTIKVKSAATNNYETGEVAFFATTAKGILAVSAHKYEGVYDGEEHTISVSVIPSATITYSKVQAGTYTAENVTYTDVGNYTVFYKVVKDGYIEVAGSETITITKAMGGLTVPVAKSLTYNGQEQELVDAGTSATGTIMYKLATGTYSTSIPKAKNYGSYTVYYKVVGDNNHNDVEEASITVAIGKAAGEVTAPTAKNLTYTGSAQELINAGSSTTGTIQYKLGTGEYGTAIPKATVYGTYTVYYKVIGDSNHNDVAENSLTVTIEKAENTLTIAEGTGTITYPNKKEIAITKNTSGGTLSCSSSNTAIATCSVDNNKLTINPQTQVGNATIYVISAETANYNSKQVAYYATTEEGILSVTTVKYEGVYDNKPHSITITANDDSTIMYSTSVDGIYSPNKPTFTNAGKYTVYYKVQKAGYINKSGSETVEIAKAPGEVTAPTAKNPIYTGSAQDLINAGSSSTGTIQYKLGTGEYGTAIPKATNPNTYTVYYRVVGDENHEDVAEASLTIKINNADMDVRAESYNGIYDLTGHSISVNAPSGATITYSETANGTYTSTNPSYTNVGTYTVYYKVTKYGYNDVSGSEAVVITQADNTLTLESTSATITYPTATTVNITANVSNGMLSCSSSNNNIATCNIENGKLKITPGTTEGAATIYVNSAATTNYKAGQVAFYATTEKGILTVSPKGYTNTYDAKAHSITVSANSGATITYSETENGTYTSVNPSYTNVGTYTVYYKVVLAGYINKTGSEVVKITKAVGSVTAPTAKTLTYTGSAQALINAGSSTTGTIQYKVGTGSYGTAIPTATDAGTYTVYYKVVGDSNHNDVAEKSISVTVGTAAGSVTAPTAKTPTYTGSAQALINAGSSTTGTIQYKVGTGSYGTAIPTATNAGTYTVYYKVVGDSNHNDVAENSISVTIAKANNTLTISENTGALTYPTTKTFTVTKNTSNGALSCTSADSSIATCSISGTTVTVTPGTKAGTAKLTISSAEVANYKAATVTYNATTALGTIPAATVNGYNGVFDGQAHSITVTCSGYNITYSTTENGTYTSTKPTYSAVGEYTIYYKISKTGYTTKSGSAKVKITTPTARDIIYEGTTTVQDALEDIYNKIK